MRQVLLAAVSYFGLVFGAGFMLGAIRVPLLVPRLGERAAELLEMPLMVGVTVLAARFVVRRHAVPLQWSVRARVGAIALALLIGAELLLAVVMQDRSLAQYIASRDPVSGIAYLMALLLYAAMPCLLMRFRRPASNN
ncbi:hypothetical protein E4T66_21155 [Sinimarinibacterium sp. CAU 1509]|nr:hypothetical protein E4T66_21155 [Sinimarinibacterium sp. CAU 1509]